MILNKLEIENFGPYLGKSTLTFPEGYTTFVGKNGHGKSRLGMAPPWILGGAKAADATEAEFRPLGTNLHPWGRLTFTDADGKQIIVERSSTNAKVFVDGKQAANSKTGAATEIERLFHVTPATIGATNYVAQGEMQNLVSKKSDIRIKTVESIIGTENFKNLESTYRRMTKDLRAELKDYDPAKYHEAATVVKVDTDRIKKYDERADKIRKDLDGLGVDAMEEKLQVNTKIAQKYFGIEDLRDACEADKAECDEKHAELLVTKKEIEAKIEDLESQLTALPDPSDHEGLMRKWHKLEDKIKISTAEVEELNNLSRGFEKDLIRADSSIKLVSKPKEEYNSKYVKSLTTDLTRTRKAYFTISAEIEDGERTKLASESDGDECSRCGTKLTRDHIEHISSNLKDNKAAIEPLQMRLEHLTDEVKSLEKLYDMWTTYRQRMTDNRAHEINAHAAREGLTNLSEKMKVKSKIHNELADKLAKVERKSIAHEATRATVDDTKITLHINALTLANTENSIRDCVGERDVLSKLIKKHERELEVGDSEFTTAVDAMNELTNRLELANDKKHMLNNTLRLVHDDRHEVAVGLASSRKLLGILEADFKNNQESADKLRLISQAKNAIKAFRHSYQNRIRPSVERITNQIYSAVGEGEYTDIKIDEEYSITGSKDGYEVPATMFSGAEKDTLAFAFRVALSRLKQLISGNPLGLMIVDEPTAQFDTDRVDNFISTLGRMKKLVPQIICITHDEKLKQADKCYMVTMVDGCSSVAEG